MPDYAEHEKGCQTCRHTRVYHKRLGKQTMSEAGGPCEKIGCKCAGFVPMESSNKNPTTRGQILIGESLTKIVTDKEIFESRGKSMGRIYGLADGSILLAGIFARAPRGAVREIWYVDAAKVKAEGLRGNPKTPWRHVFKQRIALAKVPGGLLMKAKGKRLWEVR